MLTLDRDEHVSRFCDVWYGSPWRCKLGRHTEQYIPVISSDGGPAQHAHFGQCAIRIRSRALWDPERPTWHSLWKILRSSERRSKSPYNVYHWVAVSSSACVVVIFICIKRCCSSWTTDDGVIRWNCKVKSNRRERQPFMDLCTTVKCSSLINWFYSIRVHRCVITNGIYNYLPYTSILSERVSSDVSKELLTLQI